MLLLHIMNNHYERHLSGNKHINGKRKERCDMTSTAINLFTFGEPRLTILPILKPII